MVDLTPKLVEINGKEHNKGRNISSKSSKIVVCQAYHLSASV